MLKNYLICLNTEIFAEYVRFSRCGSQTRKFRLAMKSLNTVHMAMGAFFFWLCLTNKHPPDVTSYAESPEVQRSVKKASRRFAVVITFRKSNKISPVLQ